ncbi:MAG: putative toxin-antitoxin system toxin component, PIN family [Candidatus Binatia bacterium]
MSRRVARRSRVVVDTGVVVSAFAFGGVPQQTLVAVLRAAEVCVSPDLLAEYRAVPQALLAARKITGEQFRSLVAGIAAFVSDARLMVPERVVRLCRDRKDDMVLECCLTARAHHLITGDRDLLDLRVAVAGIPGLKRLEIVTPRTYLDGVVRRRSRRR